MDGIKLTLFGKMCPEPSAATEEKTSGRCLKRLSRQLKGNTLMYLDLRTDGAEPDASGRITEVWRGEGSTHNTGESPRDAVESTLSQICEDNVQEKYYLSKKACAGILRRAERHGKEIPELLRTVLLGISTSPE